MEKNIPEKGADNLLVALISENFRARDETGIDEASKGDPETCYWSLGMEEAMEVAAPMAKLLRIAGKREIPGVLAETNNDERKEIEELFQEFMDLTVCLKEATSRNPVCAMLTVEQVGKYAYEYSLYKARRYHARQEGIPFTENPPSLFGER